MNGPAKPAWNPRIDARNAGPDGMSRSVRTAAGSVCGRSGNGDVQVSIGQALALLALLLMLMDDGFRELFFTAIGYVLFWGWLFILPVVLWALFVVVPSGRADVAPGSGTLLLFGLWWAIVFYLALRWLLLG